MSLLASKHLDRSQTGLRICLQLYLSDGVLSNPTGEIVVKPCKQSEIDFYESTSAHRDFLPHIPTFLGRITLGADNVKAQAIGAIVMPSETATEAPAGSGIGSTTLIANDWAPSNGGKIQTDLAIVLGNVAHGYKKPNILDVKLGARLWADDAPTAKRVKLDRVAAETTSKPLGFRIAGMKTYHGAPNNGKEGVTSDGYKLYDKMYGRSFTVQNIDEAFGDYFLLDKEAKATGPTRKVIKRFIGDLEAMQDVIEKEESRMYSASLLFVYEGEQQSLRNAFTLETDIINDLQHKTAHADESKNGNGTDATGDNCEIDDDEGSVEGISFPAIQSVKLIDFAHAEWTPGQGPDANLLHGIRNVIKILNELT